MPGPEISEDIIRRYFEPTKALIEQMKKINETMEILALSFDALNSALQAADYCNRYVGARVWQDRLYYSTYNVSLSALIDGLTTTGGWGSAGTSSRNHWIQLSFIKPFTFDVVYVGGGIIPNWGSAQNYHPVELRAFNEKSGSWETLKILPKLTTEKIYKYLFPRTTSRYWRLYNTYGWSATTEFRLGDIICSR